MTDPNAWLMSSGTTSAKFPTIGTVVTGTIIETPKITQQTDFKDGSLKYYSNGDPMQQLVVRLETELRDNPDDDGVRALYVKGQMKNAVRDAVKESGAPGLQVGGKLSVRYARDGEAVGTVAPKEYEARYFPADQAAADSFLGTPEPEPAPADPWGAPAQPAPAAPAPQAPPAAAPHIDPNNLPPEVAQLLANLSKQQ